MCTYDKFPLKAVMILSKKNKRRKNIQKRVRADFAIYMMYIWN